MVPICNPATREVEAGGFTSSRSAWATQRVQGQVGLQSKSLSPKKIPSEVELSHLEEFCVEDFHETRINLYVVSGWMFLQHTDRIKLNTFYKVQAWDFNLSWENSSPRWRTAFFFPFCTGGCSCLSPTFTEIASLQRVNPCFMCVQVSNPLCPLKFKHPTIISGSSISPEFLGYKLISLLV
jgi:hypothetical protein